MTTCIDPATWLKAYSDCMAMQQVKGLGVLRGSYAPVSGYGDINDLMVTASYDPCAITKQAACAGITCPPGTNKSCIVAAPGQPSPGCHCLVPKAAPTPPSLPAAPGYQTPPTTVASTVTAGFSHWGLLAAVLVGGVVVYKVATR